MLSRPSKFAARDEDVTALIQAHPLAWVITSSPVFRATPLPLRPKLDPSGRLVALIGHFARSNPQVEDLRQTPRALLLFMGPQGYISASWMTDRTQAPTWNFMAAQFECHITLIDDAEGVDECLNDLIENMERGRADAWSMSEMGGRAAQLARGVVGFRADIVASTAAFKLGQDERDDVLQNILSSLDRQAGGSALAEQMRRYNSHRV